MSSCPWLLIFGLLVLLQGCLHPLPVLAASATFRIMTFNIHHGEGTDGQVDLARIAAVINEAQADLVGLQEVDRKTSRTLGLDMPAELSRLTGLTCLFSNNYHFGGGEYGNAILSRFPVLSWTNIHYEMLSPAEQRGLIHATVTIHDRPLLFLNTHLDAGRDPAERNHAMAQLPGLLENGAPVPQVFCGDFNATPKSKVYQMLSNRFLDAWSLAGQGPGHTIPSHKPTSRIDYLWISRDAPLELVRIWVPSTEASDHLPVVGEFRWK